MDDNTRLNLQKMVKEYGTEETTDKIRNLKHSKSIQQDVQTLLNIKQKYTRMDKATVKTMAQNQCMFLWKNYTNIFNKLLIFVKIIQEKMKSKLREVKVRGRGSSSRIQYLFFA